jgi:hypothetical protein
MCGGVKYTARFYSETIRDPRTASPLLFPETVFNAPVSHLASLLGVTTCTYTLIGDSSVFLQAIAQAAAWIEDQEVDSALVLAAEEVDASAVEAGTLLARNSILAEGAAAVWMRPDRRASGAWARIERVTSPVAYTGVSRTAAARAVRDELPAGANATLLCDSREGNARLDRAETEVWQDWPGPRISPRTILGEGMTASAGWQCVAALEHLRRGTYSEATISVLGCNQAAIGAHFVRTEPSA